jgi:hypothetical protein
MTKKTGRPPGRPRKHSPAPAATTRTLPPVVPVVSDATSATDALAALDVAARSIATNDDDAPAAPVNRIAPDDIAASFPPANGNGQPAPKPTGTSLTADRFANLTNRQLQTELAIAHSDLAELREQVKTLLPARAAAKAVPVERMVSVACSAIFDVASLLMQYDEIRLDKEQERELGELGAPAIEPYLGEYGKHAPLLAFVGKLGSVVVEKVITVRIVKEQQQQRAARIPEAGGDGGGAE